VLHRGSNSSPSRAMDGRIMRHGNGIISSCQSAATSKIVKRCCSSLVSSVVTSTQTFVFTFDAIQLMATFLLSVSVGYRPIRYAAVAV